MEPHVSLEGQDLIAWLLQDKEYRLSSKRYQVKDQSANNPAINHDIFGRHVFPDDAEDIRKHPWFRTIHWNIIHSLRPPFVPQISSLEDTQYFDKSEPLEDWSESSPSVGLPARDVRLLLHDCRSTVQDVAIQLVAEPHDSTGLRRLDDEISTNRYLTTDEKELLKHFVRLYGRKQRRRPRDWLLRDKKVKDVVMDIRKKNAFLGYTWRRICPEELLVSNWTG